MGWRRSVLRCLILFAVLGVATAGAANTDWGQVVFDSVNNLVDQDAGKFVPIGLSLVAAASFAKILWGLCGNGLQRLGAVSSVGHPFMDLEEMLKILFQAWLLTQLLRYWATPGYGMAHSFHQLPMYVSDGLVSTLAASKADQFMQFVANVSTNMEHPNPLAILDVIVYILILINMGILSLAMFLLTSFSYIGEAIFVVITPLFGWCTFFETVFSWFFNCVQNMLAFAAYKVVGGIIITILSDVLLNFFLNGVGTDYSIAHWIVLLPMVIMFTGLFVFSLFLVPLLCASIFNGAGAIGEAVTLAAGRFA